MQRFSFGVFFCETVSRENREEEISSENNKGSSRGNTFILSLSMLLMGHISSGINSRPAARRWGDTAGEGERLIWSVILYGCEIKRIGHDYNRHWRNKELQKWKRWKPTEIISPALTHTEEWISFSEAKSSCFFGSVMSWDLVMGPGNTCWWCNRFFLLIKKKKHLLHIILLRCSKAINDSGLLTVIIDVMTRHSVDEGLPHFD